MIALGFSEEAGPEWVFKCFHYGVVVGEEDLVLVEGFLLYGVAPDL